MSRDADSEPLKNIINSLFKDYKLDSKFLETKIPTIWKEVVGNYINERTTKLFAKENTLFVYLSSAPLKQEMMHNRDKIISLLNERLGSEVVTEIIIK